MRQLVVAAIALLCGYNGIDAQARLRGRVLAAETDAPVAGALVVASTGARVFTHADGRFAMTVDSLPARLLVMHLGMEPDSQTITTGDSAVFRLFSAPLSVSPLLVASERSYSMGSSNVIRD